MGVMFVGSFLASAASSAVAAAAAAAANGSISSIIQWKILIPWPFQPPPLQMLVDCGVVEVGDLVVRAKSIAQKQIGSCYLPPPKMKKIVPNPLKKCSRHAIPRPFQTKPLRPLFDCHIGCTGDRAERSNSTARSQNEGDPPPPTKIVNFLS